MMLSLEFDGFLAQPHWHMPFATKCVCQAVRSASVNVAIVSSIVMQLSILWHAVPLYHTRKPRQYFDNIFTIIVVQEITITRY